MKEERWTFIDKARMCAGIWAFRSLHQVSRAVWAVSFGHIDIFRWKGKTNRLWDFWIWLASEGYLYEDWRRGDMPTKYRVNGKVIA